MKHRPYLYETGTVFQTVNGDMTVVESSRVYSAGVWRKCYTLECGKGHRYQVKEEYLKRGRLRTCKMCSHPPIVETDPEFAEWFVDKTIPENRSRYSHENADFYCQECGRIVKDKSIHTIYQRQYIPCPYCTNGISYPERYVMAVLTQMQVAFVYQHIVHLEEKIFFKYDFYDAERKIIIETHGPQHFLPGVFERFGGYSLEKIQKIDRQKEKAARCTLKARYIYLDCRKSSPDWIRKQIEKKLQIYPLEKIDWEKAAQEAKKSVLMKMIDLSKQGYTQKEIAGIVHLSASAVNVKLQEAKRCGLFDGVTPRTIKIEENKRIAARKEREYLEKKALREKTKQEIQRRKQEREEKRRQDKILEKQSREKIKDRQDVRILDDYVNRRTGLRLVCSICGKEFKRLPEKALADSSCPYCAKLAQIKQKVQENYGEEYEIMGTYADCRTPLQIRHKVCGSIFYKKTAGLMRSGCPVCAEAKRIVRSRRTVMEKSWGKFCSIRSEIEKRGYVYTGDKESFSGCSRENEFLCSHCGQIWKASPDSMMAGRNHICRSRCKKKTHEEFEKEVWKLTAGEYSVLSEYQSAFVKVKMRHNSCSYVFPIAPVSFTSQGKRCPICGKGNKPEEAEYEKRKKRYESRLEAGSEGAEFRSGNLWNQRLEDVKKYYRQYGHIDIPYGWMENGYNLGSWISDQRKAYKKGTLSQSRIDILNVLGMKWDYLDENWKKIYDEVQEYLMNHGELHLRNTSTQQERKYYYWIQDQSEMLRKGKLSEEKAEMLGKLGIQGDYKTELHFEEMCGKLEAYVRQHGHCIVPIQEGKGEEKPLGPWCQRMRCQMASGQLSAERLKRLKDIGLLSNNKEAKFEYKLGILTKYFEKHGHLMIPQSYTENGCNLGKWLNVFRVEYSKGELSAERIRKLENIGMKWKCENQKR